MPKNWNTTITASGAELSDAEAQRIADILADLDSVFRPLIAAIPHEVEPAIILSEQAVQGE